MDKVESFLVVAPVLLFSMVAHEYAHGYAALRQGDPTAYQLGRLTWNPVKHIDPFMTVLLPLMTFFLGGFIFGGAKPVPVNPRNYKNFRRGDIIVSLAGVVTNLILAGVFTILIALLGVLGKAVPIAAATLGILQYMLLTGVFFNLVLVFFNLIPIPPLDGSHVVKYLLPPAWSLRYQQIGMYGMFILIALLTVGRPVLGAWLSPMYSIFSSAQRVVVPYMLPTPFLGPL